MRQQAGKASILSSVSFRCGESTGRPNQQHLILDISNSFSSITTLPEFSLGGFMTCTSSFAQVIELNRRIRNSKNVKGKGESKP
jgi:hypothetical protein